MTKKCIIFLFLLFSLPALGNEAFPDYGQIFLGKDKFENFNRKMFNLNLKLNKFAIRPASVLWSSIMPKYGMDRIKSAYNNVLYPRRFVSSVIQKDFKSAKNETMRFVVNSTAGLLGMFDPAKKFLNIEAVNENMEQALAKLKMKQGTYLVLPVLSSTTPRGLLGKALDSALDPSCYIGTPVIAAIKAGFTLNNAALGQGLIKTIEKTFIDPYTVSKAMYGLQMEILNSNYDRKEVLKEAELNAKNNNNPYNNLANVEDNFIEIEDTKIQTPEDSTVIEAHTIATEIIKGGTATEEILYEDELLPDLILKDYNPQHPIIDSMRTALFEAEGVNKSIWGQDSVWNRSFENKIKTESIKITEGRDDYQFRYIMQKDKNSPMAIIFPSIGEGINSHHSVQLAKLFYDEGYSVTLLSSAFHFSFVKSMPKNFRPGIPTEDVFYIKRTTAKILDKLENKYNCKFKDKVVLGTSYGAISSLFLANSESVENKLNISKFISICPPIELMYAINAIDNTTEDLNKENLKEKTTLTAAKTLQALKEKKEGNFKGEQLPFSVEEARLLTGFVLHQKLSDLIFAIEDINPNKKTDFYEKQGNINYKKYAELYLTNKKYPTVESFRSVSTLHSIKNYLKNNSNYRIYHTMDDYLVNKEQLKDLRRYSKSKLTLIDRGAHLGFLYRDEFIENLKKEISLKKANL